MLSNEITVHGYLKIPHPYKNKFNSKIEELKGKKGYKDFPDFIMPLLNAQGNGIASFAYSFRYDIGFEKTILLYFETFLFQIDFLLASLIINIEDHIYFCYEYTSDGSRIYKTINNLIEKESYFLT